MLKKILRQKENDTRWKLRNENKGMKKIGNNNCMGKCTRLSPYYLNLLKR